MKTGSRMPWKQNMPDIDSAVIAEYVQLGIISPRTIKELQFRYELSDPETENLVSDLIARDVWVLSDEESDQLSAVQSSVFYQDRRRYNSLLNELPLRRLLSIFLALPEEVQDVPVTWFHNLPSGRQYLRELSRLRLVTAGETKDRVRLSDGFRRLQAAVHGFLDGGYVPGFKHSWRQVACQDAARLAVVTYESPFFATVVLPAFRDYYLSLPEVQKWTSWIGECKKQPPTMCDIVAHALARGESRELWWLLLGDAPSSAPAAIENGRDVCFKCLKIGECTPHFAGQYDRWAIHALLRRYRDNIAVDFLRQAADGCVEAALPRLANDAMLIKFVARYSMVRSAKTLLAEIAILVRHSKVLRKDIGQYCPRRDIWRLDREIPDGNQSGAQRG